MTKFEVDGEFVSTRAITSLCFYICKVHNKLVVAPFPYCWEYSDPTVLIQLIGLSIYLFEAGSLFRRIF